MNWGNWQYTPLWMVDYIIVVWLLAGALSRGTLRSVAILKGAWAFAFGVMYMALAVVTDPKNANVMHASSVVLALIGLLIAVSLVGLALAYNTKEA